MKSLLMKMLLVACILFFPVSFASADNLGFFGLNLNADLPQTLEKSISDGLRIKIYGSNLDSEFASKMLALSYQYEVSNMDNPNKQFENEHSIYNIITNLGEIKYAKGFTVYNFLNRDGERIGSFIYDDDLEFIKKNKYDLNIIPVKLYKENVTIDMIFYAVGKDARYMPLFFGVSFFKLESVHVAIDKLNARFGNFSNINAKNISARYWQKDGTSVANYFGLNDRFVFYNIETIKNFNKIENGILKQLASENNAAGTQGQKDGLKQLHEAM